MINVAVGVFLVRHHRGGWINFLTAGFILGVNLYGGIVRRRIQWQAAAIDQGIPMNVTQKAKKNLLRVVKVTRATWNEEYEMVTLRPRKTKSTFLIQPSLITRCSGQSTKVTCFLMSHDSSKGRIPTYEQMATAVLLLNYDPKLFYKWYSKDGKFYA